MPAFLVTEYAIATTPGGQPGCEGAPDSASRAGEED